MLSIVEMRMLRWMSGFTLRYRIRNEHIHEMVGVALVEDKIRESHLRWFGHIKWRPSDDLARKALARYNFPSIREEGKTLQTISGEAKSPRHQNLDLKTIQIQDNPNPSQKHLIKDKRILQMT